MKYKILIGKSHGRNTGKRDIKTIEKLALENGADCDSINIQLTKLQHLGAEKRDAVNKKEQTRVLLNVKIRDYQPFEHSLYNKDYFVINLIEI